MTRLEDDYPIEPPVHLQFEPAAPEYRRRRPRTRTRTRTRVGVAAGLSLATVIAGAGLWAVLNPQPITDQFTVWNFAPTAQIQAHVNRLQLTDHGRFLYYASTPEVSDHDLFATQCPPREDEKNFGILGCYLPSSQRIFLFDVTDERLDGSEEVTAAHEMLHAAWDRMDDTRRTEVTALLEADYTRLTAEPELDPELVERMEFYARTQPGERANELHSIIGTEYNNLSPALEMYYDVYFADRTIVTALHVSSNAAFVELATQADTLIAQLDALRVSIESDYSDYEAGYDILRVDVDDFNRRAAIPGGFSTRSEFDENRATLGSRQDGLDALYASITARTAQYDALVLELDAVNSTAAELQRGLNIGEQADSAL